MSIRIERKPDARKCQAVSAQGYSFGEPMTKLQFSRAYFELTMAGHYPEIGRRVVEMRAEKPIISHERN
jgi:hypothetical protein